MLPEPCPTNHQAYRLLHEGSLALAEAERYGMRIDTDYCAREILKLGRRIRRTESRFFDTEQGRLWRETFGAKTNIQADDQLRTLLYDKLKYKPPARKDKYKKEKVDFATLSEFDEPFLHLFLERKKMVKTFQVLSNVLAETVDGIVHPFFNLHLVVTFRSSCDSPNTQNQPKRDPHQAEVVRQAFVPRKGHMLFEFDYGGMELKGSCLYHKDPRMIYDIVHGDMHSDMAVECYLLENDEQLDFKGNIRYCAKNKWNFPQLYRKVQKDRNGRYHSFCGDCSKNLWDSISNMNLATSQGIPLKKHLKSKGIKSYRAFEQHIERVGERFWSERYPICAKWKGDFVKDYESKGYIDLLSGFRCQGVIDYNQIVNYPVQGVSFHMLLWSFIRITQIANERGWVSRPIGQIHDSIIMDVDPKELNEVCRTVFHVMTREIRRHWKWIVVPLEVEAEATMVDASWYHKRKMKRHDCGCGVEWCCKFKYEKDGEVGVGLQCPVCGEKHLPF